MQLLSLSKVAVRAVSACLPARSVDNAGECRRLYGDKAESIIRTTGIEFRRVADDGVSSCDLCVRAAREIFAKQCVAPSDIGAVVSVSFTPENRMPGNAFLAHARLGLDGDALAVDLNAACAGYCYGLYFAGTLANSLQRPVLLLDGDVQSGLVDGDDRAMLPLLSDAGSATLLAPDDDGLEWKFSFLSKGAKADVLNVGPNGNMFMNGFEVFKFVSMDVVDFLGSFLKASNMGTDDIEVMAPHQANVYMVRQLAKALGVGDDRVLVSADKFGNCASASVPVTLASAARKVRKALLCGFGGGLSASAAILDLHDAEFMLTDYDGRGK